MMIQVNYFDIVIIIIIILFCEVYYLYICVSVQFDIYMYVYINMYRRIYDVNVKSMYRSFLNH